MNKRIFFLALIQVCLFTTATFAQIIPDPCNGTGVTCLSSATRDVGSGHNWRASHGALSISSNNRPGSTAGGSLVLWSFLNTGSGAFTCFNFQQSHTYRVCFWIRNNSGWPSNPFGRFYVYAAKNLDDKNPSGSTTVPSVSTQLIDQTYYGPPQDLASYPTGEHEWQFITATFTANVAYTSLWLYALNPMGTSPPGPIQYNTSYTVEVDDIRVIEEPTPPAYNPSVTATPSNTISGCNGSTQLDISATWPAPGTWPTGVVATWTPSASLTNLNAAWSSVIAKPCETTTYKIEITDQGSTCPTCVKEVLYYTVNVNQWSDPARIIYPPTIGCTSTINLDYNDPGGCAVSYKWIDPQGTFYYGKTKSIPNANAYQTGEWTLEITTPKGCAEVHKFNITVGSCCVSNPSFTFSGCNPVSFTNTSTGITYLKSALWDFGDGTKSDAMSPVHTYNVTVATTFTVCLTMLYQDGQGQTCCSRKCTQVHVCPKTNGCAVSADFRANSVSGFGNTFDFTDASTGSGTICGTYTWTFPGGIVMTSTLPTIRYTFTTPGPWLVCLTVANCIYDKKGNLIDTCMDSTCKMIYPPAGMMIPSNRVMKPGSENSSKGDPARAKANGGTATTPAGGIKMYPNPSKGILTIEFAGYDQKDTSVVVRLTDILGQDLGILYSGTRFTTKTLKLPDIPTGLYLIEIYSGDKVIFKEKLSVE